MSTRWLALLLRGSRTLRAAGLGCAIALAMLSGAASPASARPAAVPQGFVGMDMDGPLLTANTPLDLYNQMTNMVSSGVESVRVAFNWAQAQPYSSWAKVPPSQRANFTVSEPRPTDFTRTDEIVTDAAEHGLTVLPTILYTPGWDARHNPHGVATPRRAAPYAQYAAALVGRYGPNGSFWAENPQVPVRPIRMWQIWNEPNLPYDWQQPFARTYVPLLRAAHDAIKHADPQAKIVLGALTNYAWKSIAQVYARHARKLFDVVSVNAFTKFPSGVITYMRLMRRALRAHGDGRKPLLATEVSWPAALGQTPQNFDFNTTPARQASNIAALLPMIGRQRKALGLSGFYYYTWIGNEQPGAQAFNFAGLLRYHDGQVTAKPALPAFQNGVLALEHCRAKGSLATVCLH